MASKGQANVVRASHIGLCVRDLEETVRFYCEGLGFKDLGRFELGQEVARISHVQGDVHLKAAVIGRETIVLELLSYPSPGSTPHPGVKSMNQNGLTHVAMAVEDVDTAIAALEKLGGTVIEGSRASLEYGDFVMMLDPNGSRVELMRLDGIPFEYPA